MKLSEAMQNYIKHLDKVNTISSYQESFGGFGVLFGDRDVSGLTSLEIRDYLNSLPVSKHTRHLRFVHIKALFNRTIRDLHISGQPVFINPCDILSEDFRRPRINGEALPDDIDKRIKDFTGDLLPYPAYKLIADLGIRCGLRVSESLGLTPEDLLEQAGYAFLRIQTPKSGANHELRPCPVDLMAEIKSYALLKGICSDKRIFPMTRQAVWVKFASFGFKPHFTRKCAAYRAQKQGASLKTIQGMLAHKSPMTTTRYLQDLGPMALARALEGM